MKTAVIYSSKTGNTRRVAEAIHRAAPDGTHVYDVKSAPDPAEFDMLIVGFWADKGGPDADADAYLSRITGKQVGLFFTLGADPDCDHARDCYRAGCAALGPECDVVASFWCQGAVAPQMIEWMKRLPADHPHAPNPERVARWARAAQHPNDEDLASAAEVFATAIRAVASMVTEPRR